MTEKHIPGPWKISTDGCDIDQDSESAFGICTMYADESSEANAHLIAAAPDMLEACKSILRDYGYDSSIKKQLTKVVNKAEGRE